MSWVRIDDGLPTHPKIVQAGPLAAWLYICGLVYAGRYLTDGFLPANQVRLLADVPNAAKLTARLVEAGLWEAVAGGYQIHDYLEYQPSRERALTTRDARAQAGAKGGQIATHPTHVPDKQNASNLLSKPGANSPANEPQVAEQTASNLPGRSRKDPVPDLDSSSESNANTAPPRARGERLIPGVNAPPILPAKPLPKAFPLTEEMRAWAAMEVPALSSDLDRQHKLFCAHYWARQDKEKRSDWRPEWEAWLWRALKEFAPRNGAPAAASPPRRYLNGEYPDAE